MERDDAPEIIKRAELLSHLREGPADTEALERNSSASRSTVHRAMRSLTEKGLVEDVDGTFGLTGVGEVVAARTDTYLSELESIARLEPLLNVVDADSVDLPLEHLTDATVVRPRAGHPHLAVKRLRDMLADADSMRMFSRVVSPIYVDIANRSVRNGAEIQAVFNREVVDVLFSEYGAESRESARTGRFEVKIHDECPFELFLFDERVGLTAHDSEGLPTAFVETSNPAVAEWAESLFGRYWSDAEYATLF
ncbi:helix-turn-helix transcriptional regulator [Halomarina litorea]|uniref:helix-turn-helix transcriptional regulator n=1 Tax=Halomarina litorea TaxID=2961595 RepID=UPI0020C3B926|nr:helix-turn-helix domain-containing protein [Halomarina sp. BCD28]